MLLELVSVEEIFDTLTPLNLRLRFQISTSYLGDGVGVEQVVPHLRLDGV